jgi:hypothetical protein
MDEKSKAVVDAFAGLTDEAKAAVREAAPALAEAVDALATPQE